MIIILISELSVIFLLFIREIGVRSQDSGDRRQESVVSSQETGDYFYLFSPHSTRHTPLPHTLHPNFPDDREKTSSRGEQLPVR